MQLDPALPHLDQRNFERAAAEQRRLGMERLEVTADGDRLSDYGAIVELQRGHPLHRIDRRKRIAALLKLAEVNLLGRNRNALLGQEHANAARIGGAATVIELHPKSPFHPFEWARLSSEGEAGQSDFHPLDGHERPPRPNCK